MIKEWGLKNDDKRNIRILFDIEYLNNLYLMNINEQF